MAKIDPARCRTLIASARGRYASTGVVGTADALDLADQLESSLEELSHATAHDGDWLSKASRSMCETVLGDREALRARVRVLTAEVEALRCGDLGAFHDGELSPERETAFRLHLATCAACEAGLLPLMQLDARLRTSVPDPTREP